MAKQPTAPVDRIPEMKEMSLEQQLEFGMVWRGTEGDLWRFMNLHYRLNEWNKKRHFQTYN